MNNLSQSAWNCVIVAGGQPAHMEWDLLKSRKCAYNSWKPPELSRHLRSIQKDCLHVWENWESLNLSGVGNDQEWKAASKASLVLVANVKWRKIVRLLQNVEGSLVVKRMKKMEVLNAFVLFSTEEVCCQVCQVPYFRGSLREWIIIINLFKACFRQFNICRSMGPDRMYLWVQRESHGLTPAGN